MWQCDIYPGEQLISVMRNGSRARQQVPASADAFVWHRLYQQELLRLGVPRGRRQPAWWTLRRPHRPLTYHGAYRMFERVNASLGAEVRDNLRVKEVRIDGAGDIRFIICHNPDQAGDLRQAYDRGNTSSAPHVQVFGTAQASGRRSGCHARHLFVVLCRSRPEIKKADLFFTREFGIRRTNDSTSVNVIDSPAPFPFWTPITK